MDHGSDLIELYLSYDILNVEPEIRREEEGMLWLEPHSTVSWAETYIQPKAWANNVIIVGTFTKEPCVGRGSSPTNQAWELLWTDHL